MDEKENAILLLGVRSALNVGAITRSAAAFGVTRIFTTDGTPYPRIADDPRLPHIAHGADTKIAKTALGAQHHITFQPVTNTKQFLHDIAHTFTILALEQAKTATPLNVYHPPFEKPWLLIVGHETAGIPDNIMHMADTVLEIAHTDMKESLNVSVATGIALFWLHCGAEQQ